MTAGLSALHRTGRPRVSRPCASVTTLASTFSSSNLYEPDAQLAQLQLSFVSREPSERFAHSHRA
jgi:hypothetical protein